MMDWVLTLMSSVVVMLLVVPLVVLVGGILLVWAIGHILLGSPIRSRAVFDCPFAKQRASVEFLSLPGAGQPSDVLACSVFPKPDHVRCGKACLKLAESGWMPSPMMPRYALLADGVSYRPVRAPGDPAPEGGSPREAMRRAA
jgi:hypothetical protein